VAGHAPSPGHEPKFTVDHLDVTHPGDRRHFILFLDALFGQVDNFGVGSGFDRPNALLGVVLRLAGGDDLAVARL
jgi:hypothetical protein